MDDSQSKEIVQLNKKLSDKTKEFAILNQKIEIMQQENELVNQFRKVKSYKLN